MDNATPELWHGQNPAHAPDEEDVNGSPDSYEEEGRSGVGSVTPVPSNGQQSAHAPEEEEANIHSEEHRAVVFCDANGNEGWRPDRPMFCLEDLDEIADQG